MLDFFKYIITYLEQYYKYQNLFFCNINFIELFEKSSICHEFRYYSEMTRRNLNYFLNFLFSGGRGIK